MSYTKGKETRDKIISVVRPLLHEYGYKDVTMNMIADAAGVSISLVKKYFPKKGYIIELLGRNQIFNVRRKVKNLLFNLGYKMDPLMEYIITIKIVFTNLYNDEVERSIHYERLEFVKKTGMDDELASYDYISELYEAIVRVYAPEMSTEEFHARKIQIEAGQNAIANSYSEEHYFKDDKARLDYNVSIACYLLGVSRPVYSEYSKKADEILATINYDDYKE